MDNVFTIRLGDKEALKLLDLCKEEERTAAAMLRILIREGIETREAKKERVPA